MKKSLYILFVIVPLMILFCFTQCRKEHTPLTITLYDKPLGTIQSFIQGKWKLEYEKGGICAICITYFNNVNYIWQFNSGNKIKQIYNENVFTDTTIIWIRDRGLYINGDSTFIMNFYDNRRYPYNYVVDGIFNDSLVLHDNYTADPVFYHFSKSN